MDEDALSYRFDAFLLDVANRQLWRDGAPVDLNARYFDALVLLVQEHGRLVEKDRFFADVWDDVIVSDSALTQCIKDIRKALGDSATSPRYIQTVPRHGYRFIALVATRAPAEAALPEGTDPGRPVLAPSPSGSDVRVPTGPRPRTAVGRVPSRSWQDAALWGTAGALGGGFAGVLGGLLYGSALAYAPSGAGLGTASILLVLLSLNVLVGFVGGAGVSFGIAAVGWVMRRASWWTVAGAAFGGLVVGGGAKLLGVDAFTLLLGRAPAGFTGGLEGAALGLALALGARLGGGLTAEPRWRPVVGAGIGGAVAGALIPAAGGHLMGGSLEMLAHAFGDSRLRLDALGRLFGEGQFGDTAQIVLGSVEGLLFGSCVVGALVLARRVWSRA